MAEDVREPNGEGGAAERPPAAPGDAVRERAAAARRSVTESLRAVLADLEREQAAVEDELSAPAEEPTDRIEAVAWRAAEAAVAKLARRLDETVEHTDHALALIADSERWMLEFSRRVSAAGWRVADALALAGRVAGEAERLETAARVESEVAERIAAAQQRLAERLAEEP